MGTRSDGLTLEMTRTLSAAPALVFEAFTDPDQVRRWWGPEGFGTPGLEFEAAVGKSYRIEMQPPEGDPFYLAGEFSVVDPPSRLAFTFRWEDPDPDDVETVADLLFRGLGDATEVVLTQGHFKTEPRRALHRDGWTDSFNRLETLLSSRT